MPDLHECPRLRHYLFPAQLTLYKSLNHRLRFRLAVIMTRIEAACRG